ncbi:MAG TPA: toxin-antitoxin system HicB family antitoxin [Planctomycetaceae bacterium]|nr:toxin-antitoxin system HicB family antitoxin [Planctomycetaceae bacterium]
MKTTDDKIQQKAAAMLKYAQSAKRGCKTWYDLHNKVFGVGGKLSELFPTKPERLAFSRTVEAAKIHALIESLPGDDPEFSRTLENANGRILVRVPKSVHAKLLLEAEREGVSLNLLCASKLSADLASVIQ